MLRSHGGDGERERDEGRGEGGLGVVEGGFAAGSMVGGALELGGLVWWGRA